MRAKNSTVEKTKTPMATTKKTPMKTNGDLGTRTPSGRGVVDLGRQGPRNGNGNGGNGTGRNNGSSDTPTQNGTDDGRWWRASRIPAA